MGEFTKFNASRNAVKAIEGLLGICRGLTADNHLNDQEIQFLTAWLKDNCDLSETWPVTVINQRLALVLSDGVITEDERQDLVDMLKSVCGQEFMEMGSPEAAPISLPFDDVEIRHLSAGFCLTGKFISGPRSSVERTIESNGGLVVPGVSKKTDYLLVGSLSSPDWLHSSYGLKIKKAMELKERGHSIAIISEQRWRDSIF